MGLILSATGERRVVTFKAVIVSQLDEFYRLDMVKSPFTSPYPDVYIGQVLAHRLNLQVGDDVRLLSPLDYAGGMGLPRQVKGFVRGIFKAQVLDYDDRLVYVPTTVGRTLFTRKTGWDGIDLRLAPQAELTEVVGRLKSLLPPTVKVRSFTELHEGLFQAMRMERLGSLAILSLIILVACFNLASTLVLVSYQKIREIGILRTLGTSAAGIQRIILTQGFMVGGAGLVAGLMLGLGLVLLQQRVGIFPLPEEIYFMNKVPMVLFPRDVVVVPLIAVSLIFVSAYLASRRAVLIQPKEAVHMEK
jgi:lipoprotein-releasing system permease protein